MELSRKPKWITFDCYGTLIDTRQGYTEVWQEILDRKGTGSEVDVMDYVQAWGEEEFHLIQGPYRKYRDILVASVEATLRKKGLLVTEGDGKLLADRWGTFPAYADVKPTLEKLHKDYKLAIISNADNDILKQSVANIGIDFDKVFSAEDCQAYKPSRVPFEFALKGMGVEPRDVLHVAFGYQYDHATASQMGFMTLWVNRRQLTLSPDARKFDMEIPDMSTIPGLIES